MNKIIVFHIISKFGIGGAEKIASDLVSCNDPLFEFHIFPIYEDKSDYGRLFVEDLQKSKATIHFTKIRNIKLAILLFHFKLFYYYLRIKPNIFHFHTEVPDLAVFIFLKLYSFFLKKIVCVRTIHNTLLWDKWTWLGKIVETYFFKKGVVSIPVSKSVRASYIDCFSNNLSEVIYNGVKRSPFTRNFNTIKNSNKIKILFAGRFVEQKGINTVVEVILALKKMSSNYHFYLIGDGPLLPYAKKQLQECNYVEFAPPLYDLPTYFNSFDYLFMPSKHEGFGLLSIEASMHGLPVIAPNIPGLNETLPKNWPLFTQHNTKDEILFLFKNELPYIDRSELVNLSKLFVESQFSIKVMQKNYISIYKKLCGF